MISKGVCGAAPGFTGSLSNFFNAMLCYDCGTMFNIFGGKSECVDTGMFS